jgi:hypothetical protein
VRGRTRKEERNYLQLASILWGIDNEDAALVLQSLDDIDNALEEMDNLSDPSSIAPQPVNKQASLMTLMHSAAFFLRHKEKKEGVEGSPDRRFSRISRNTLSTLSEEKRSSAEALTEGVQQPEAKKEKPTFLNRLQRKRASVKNLFTGFRSRIFLGSKRETAPVKKDAAEKAEKSNVLPSPFPLPPVAEEDSDASTYSFNTMHPAEDDSSSTMSYQEPPAREASQSVDPGENFVNTRTAQGPIYEKTVLPPSSPPPSRVGIPVKGAVRTSPNREEALKVDVEYDIGSSTSGEVLATALKAVGQYPAETSSTSGTSGVSGSIFDIEMRFLPPSAEAEARAGPSSQKKPMPEALSRASSVDSETYSRRVSLDSAVTFNEPSSISELANTLYTMSDIGQVDELLPTPPTKTENTVTYQNTDKRKSQSSPVAPTKPGNTYT